MWVKNNAGKAMFTDHPRRDCLSYARSWLDKSGRKDMPTPEEWVKNKGMLTIIDVEEIFGSYDEMLKLLETFDPYDDLIDSLEKKLAKSVRRSGEKSGKRQYSDTELAKALYRVYQDKGGYFTGSQYANWRGGHLSERLPSVTTVTKRLGDNGKWSLGIFDRMWQLLGFGTQQPEPSSESAQTLKSEFAFASLDLGNGIKLRSYHLISLLGYDCKLNFDGFHIEAPKDSPSVILKEHKTIKAVAPNESVEISEFKLILEQDGREIELPGPSPDVIYLIDPSLYESIPANQRRNDLLPVYQSEHPESDPIGLHVLAM